MKTIATVIALALSGFAVASAATAVTRTSNGYEYTAQDAHRAVAAYYRMATDHSFTVASEVVPAQEMPSWDRVAHYVGLKTLPNGTLVYDVWVNEAYQSAINNLSNVNRATATQIISAMLMAAIDGKLAGPKWKSFFDDATRRDRALSPAITDRYYNRHALVAKLAADTSAFTALRPTGVVGLSGNNLTSPISYAQGLAGVAQVGIGVARITELLDDQRALAEAQSQQFIDDCFSHFAAMLTDENARAFLAQQRSLLVVDASFDRMKNSRDFAHAIGRLASSLPVTQREAFLVGSYAEQVSYNATVTRDSQSDTTFRSAMGQTSTLDDALPQLAPMRQRLADLPAGNWKDIATQSDAILKYILAAR
jgi:hypothetical protein